MSYTHHIKGTSYSISYEDNVAWLKSQYEKYGDRIVFADISPNEKTGYRASIIVKDQTEPESQTEQNKIQL